MIELDNEQLTARTWFEHLRDVICAEFTAIEREAGSDASFDYTGWDRIDPSGAPGGGGMRGVMKGKVFEKVGVNVSTVGAHSRAISPNPSTAQARTQAFSPPASALSRTWRIRTSPPST